MKEPIPIVIGDAPVRSDLWFGGITVSAERQRLERNVLDAVMLWRRDWLLNAQPLREAVDALEAFESEVKVRKEEAEILTRGY